MSTHTENSATEIFDEVPGRFQAALQFLHWAQSITDPCRCCNPMVQGRALTAREQATYDAALLTMRLYLSGEVDMCGPGISAERTPPAHIPEVPPATPEGTWRIEGPGIPPAARPGPAGP